MMSLDIAPVSDASEILIVFFSHDDPTVIVFPILYSVGWTGEEKEDEFSFARFRSDPIQVKIAWRVLREGTISVLAFSTIGHDLAQGQILCDKIRLIPHSMDTKM